MECPFLIPFKSLAALPSEMAKPKVKSQLSASEYMQRVADAIKDIPASPDVTIEFKAKTEAGLKAIDNMNFLIKFFGIDTCEKKDA